DAVFRQIGGALDEVICASKDGPWRVQPELAEAFIKENGRLPQGLKTQEGFMAHVISSYLLDPKNCQREFPAGFAEVQKVLSDQQPDRRAISDFERALEPPAV